MRKPGPVHGPPPMAAPSGYSMAPPLSQPPGGPHTFYQPPGGGPGSGPNMAFMSFDLGNTASTYAPPPRAGLGGTGLGNYFDDEPPLLEELGINIPLIVRRVTSMLNPMRLNVELHEDGDLSGPLLLCMLLGLCQLLAGKVYFGVVLGWSALASLFLYYVVSMLAGAERGLPLYRCCSLFGYCLLPLVLLSAVTIFLPPGTSVALLAAGLMVLWSARSCSGLFVALLPHMEQHRQLLAYSCALTYAAFALLIIF
eukprot:SM000138S00020  [mRNA]  locus=s138:15970:17814:- [translate_table: standard]